MAEIVLRDKGYLETYGCYPCSSVIELEASSELDKNLTSFKLLRLFFSAEKGKQALQEETAGKWQISFKGSRQLQLSFKLNAGYYLLVLYANGHRQSGLSLTIDDKTEPADVAVIKPIFTAWSYHSSGFYFNEYRSPADRLLGSAGYRGGRGGQIAEAALRKLARVFRLPNINFPYKAFPANETINLGGFYRRNNRWDKLMWDANFGRLEGLWVDEVISGMPIFALLDKNGIRFHVYTDADLHKQNPALENYRVLIFSGQEGITRNYYEMLDRLQSRNATRFLIWGVQGFGYRQLEYDPQSGDLRYVCTRGRQGMWGDRLEDRQPDWSDEGKLFGFHFPEPQSATWRYDKPYSRIVFDQDDHPIVRESSYSSTYQYEVTDLSGATHSGLTWAGGEVQKRVMPEAKIIAHLDGDQEIIGIGEYRNAVIFAPTYLPAFFSYQASQHPEIESWFIATLNYLKSKTV